jgi:hypothetical protein
MKSNYLINVQSKLLYSTSCDRLLTRDTHLQGIFSHRARDENTKNPHKMPLRDSVEVFEDPLFRTAVGAADLSAILLFSLSLLFGDTTSAAIFVATLELTLDVIARADVDEVVSVGGGVYPNGGAGGV